MARTGTGLRSLSGPSSRPTPERAAKAEAIEMPVMNGAVRPWWGVHCHLDRLHVDRLISAPAYAAACRFRSDCEHVATVSGSRLDRLGERVAGESSDRHGDRLGRVGAVRRLREIRARLGPRGYAVIYAVAVEDTSWSELARRLGVGDGAARRLAAAAIARLAS